MQFTGTGVQPHRNGNKFNLIMRSIVIETVFVLQIGRIKTRTYSYHELSSRFHCQHFKGFVCRSTKVCM